MSRTHADLRPDKCTECGVVTRPRHPMRVEVAGVVCWRIMCMLCGHVMYYKVERFYPPEA